VPARPGKSSLSVDKTFGSEEGKVDSGAGSYCIVHNFEFCY
jgi:hypothetical protein